MNRSLQILKRLLPDRDMELSILRGPLRGGVFTSRPHVSLRKIFGIYEHELNGWLSATLPNIDLVLDVGANDGYFTFGCAAAMRRHGKSPRVIAFEPDLKQVRRLEQARHSAGLSEEMVHIVPKSVGRIDGLDTTTLDKILDDGLPHPKTLIKIDVEGAELDVIAGARRWLRPDNFFLIEVHRHDYLAMLSDVFIAAGIKLVQVDQRPLPLIGRESRDIANWWLISDLNR